MYYRLMADNIQVNGKMENNMEKDYILRKMEFKEKGFGMTESDNNGLMNDIFINFYLSQSNIGQKKYKFFYFYQINPQN